MSTYEPKRFARHLRSAREELELRQEDVAARSKHPTDPEATTISAAYISALELAQRRGRPSEGKLEAIARGLGHQDSYAVKAWAGFETPPDWSKLLRAIDSERYLAKQDKALLKQIVIRLSNRPEE